MTHNCFIGMITSEKGFKGLVKGSDVGKRVEERKQTRTKPKRLRELKETGNRTGENVRR